MVRAPIVIQNDEVEEKVGGARFASVTYRLFKLEGLEPQGEDYGQVATYRGDAPGVGAVFHLDARHAFHAGRPERVSGNTAAMLGETRFAPHFDVIGDRSVQLRRVRRRTGARGWGTAGCEGRAVLLSRDR